MTTAIRKEIKKILSTQRAQHDRIKDVLIMICDEIDDIKITLAGGDNSAKLSKLQAKVKGDKKDGNE